MEEQDVLRWAKNSSTVNAPRGMDSLQYKKATAVEALVGLLYLTDRYRCLELIEECVDELITY
jgi:ribonuclease-3 family protein